MGNKCREQEHARPEHRIRKCLSLSLSSLPAYVSILRQTRHYLQCNIKIKQVISHQETRSFVAPSHSSFSFTFLLIVIGIHYLPTMHYSISLTKESHPLIGHTLSCPEAKYRQIATRSPIEATHTSYSSHQVVYILP
jgi:hypothetical protein